MASQQSLHNQVSSPIEIPPLSVEPSASPNASDAAFLDALYPFLEPSEFLNEQEVYEYLKY